MEEWPMKSNLLIALCIVATSTTAAFAQTKSGAKTDAQAPTGELSAVLKAVTQMQSDVKALQATVATLAASQNDQAAKVSAQLTDIARRLYATCVLTQRQMDISVPGGWSENALCNYKGLTAAGEAVTGDIFGKNPTNIDKAFGGP
jgi:hypothetical protein